MSRSFRFLALATAAVVLSSCAAMTDADTPPASAPSATPAYEQLLADVRILSADDMEGRDTGAAGGERARAYIVSRFEALGIAAPPVGRLQPWSAQGRTRAGPRTYNGVNILGLVEGTRVADRYIVITAHYDHVGISEGQIYNGADDNASGVATMLEIAARLKAAPPEHSVIFVAFDGEEHGLLGAKHFVQAPPVPLSSIALMMCPRERPAPFGPGRIRPCAFVAMTISSRVAKSASARPT